MKDISDLRSLFLQLSKVGDLNSAFDDLKNKQNFSKELALNILNLQQAWTVLEEAISKSNIKPSVEFIFAELLGHYYGAETLLFDCLTDKNTAKIKILSSLKASQEVLSELSAFTAKYSILVGNLSFCEGVLVLNQDCLVTEGISKELNL